MAKTIPSRPKASSRDTVSTLEMVAAKAGVSPSTVSRFLNGTATVSEAKRMAIEAAIKKLNFVANPIASGLAGGKSRCIGVVTQAIDSPFYGRGLMGIEEVLIAADYVPLFVSSHWREQDEMRCISSLEGRRVDGIIILTACLPDKTLLDVAKRTPMVITGRDLGSGQLISLKFDHYNGARMATEHLISLGHRQIAFLKGTPSHPDATERLNGYRAALKAHDIPYDPKLTARGDFGEASGEKATQLLFNSGVKFSAIFAANDQMAYGAYSALYQLGLRIPDDISVVGFDDLPASSFISPPLTTVKHSIYEIGKIAAQTMIQLIGGSAPSPEAPPPELIIRKSTQSYPADSKQ
ncbi:MAG TPA: LacI family DNA-binding transcriptional regulator [Halothiobacillus sp.]|nr:LacI family DNA-binding transcriptional regulator [Halothiobacillus sp.]